MSEEKKVGRGKLWDRMKGRLEESREGMAASMIPKSLVTAQEKALWYQEQGLQEGKLQTTILQEMLIELKRLK